LARTILSPTTTATEADGDPVLWRTSATPASMRAVRSDGRGAAATTGEAVMRIDKQAARKRMKTSA
jgi:hypothetical protein